MKILHLNICGLIVTSNFLTYDIDKSYKTIMIFNVHICQLYMHNIMVNSLESYTIVCTFAEVASELLLP